MKRCCGSPRARQAGLLLLMLLGPAALPAQVVPPVRDRALADAINLLQGSTPNLWLDSAQVDQMANALRVIRQEFPELADITSGHDRSLLSLSLEESLGIHLYPILGGDRELHPLVPTGVPMLDSLNLAFGVTGYTSTALGGAPERGVPGRVIALRLRIPGRPNIPVIAQRYAAVPGVAMASPPFYFGGSGYKIFLLRKPNADLFVFSRGYGDCDAGCTTHDYFHVAIEPVGSRPVLERTSLQVPLGPAEVVSHWDVPNFSGVQAYPDADSLLRALAAPEWWFRKHAVGAVAELLGPATGPQTFWPERRPGHFADLKRKVQERRARVLRMLVPLLADADPDVAALTLATLRSLTGQEFTADVAGRRAWLEWLQHQRPSCRVDAPG